MTIGTHILRAARRTPLDRTWWRSTLGATLESDHAPLAVGLIGAALVALAGLAAVIGAADHERPLTATLTALTAAAVGCALAFRHGPHAVRALATIGAILVITAFSRRVFDDAPTVVWLFAYVIPAVGLVRGAAQGALAGLLSEPALHWIETGTPVPLLDPQAPFGFLILIALGSVPAYLLSVAVARRHALDAQLERATILLREAESAREAERQAQEQAVFMLARAAEARDGTTGLHIVSVRDLAAELAIAAAVEPRTADEIAWSAMLHDVGSFVFPIECF